MKLSTIAIIVTLLVGCATQSGPTPSDAIQDFIHVSELEEREAVRTLVQFNYTYLTERYVILKIRDDNYLVQFRRRCHELTESNVTPDIRYDKNVLRSGIDTIRGCRIDKMFAIDKVQAQELENIGKAPGDTT